MLLSRGDSKNNLDLRLFPALLSNQVMNLPLLLQLHLLLTTPLQRNTLNINIQ